MEQAEKYTEAELRTILELLNNAPTAGRENLIRLLAMIEKTVRMIESESQRED